MSVKYSFYLLCFKEMVNFVTPEDMLCVPPYNTTWSTMWPPRVEKPLIALLVIVVLRFRVNVQLDHSMMFMGLAKNCENNRRKISFPQNSIWLLSQVRWVIARLLDNNLGPDSHDHQACQIINHA